MVKVIGLVILLYGVAGIVGSYLLYRALQSPIGRLRSELQALAGRLGLAKGQVDGIVKVLREQVEPALRSLAKQLGVIAMGVGITSGCVAAERDKIRDIAGWFRSWQVWLPTANAVSKPVNLDVSLTVNELSFPEYEILGLKVCGFPPTVTPVQHTLLELGSFNVVTALDIREWAPLEPVAGVFDVAADKVDEVREGLDDTKLQIDGAKTFVDDQAQGTDDAAQQLVDLGADLENGRQQLTSLSQNRWLQLGPTVVIGYFAVMHLAFALTGVALLLV